jgi:hypothetical protein
MVCAHCIASPSVAPALSRLIINGSATLLMQHQVVSPYLLGEDQLESNNTTRRSEGTWIEGQITTVKESSVKWHMSQHDITMQLKEGARETLVKKRVSNHVVRPEGNQLQDAAGVYCYWKIQHFQCVLSKCCRGCV